MKKLINSWTKCSIETKIGLVIFSPIVILILLSGWIFNSIFDFIENYKSL